MQSLTELAARNEARAELDRILDGGLIRPVYQPVVDLADERVVAYEALARGPEGSLLERPDQLFAAEREADRITELDWACCVAALSGAVDAGLRTTLLVNLEPSTISGRIPRHIASLLDHTRWPFDVIVEVTERAIT